MIINACINKIVMLKTKILTTPLGKTIIMTLLCGLVHIITKNVTFSADTIVFFNFTAIAFVTAILYQSIKDSHLYESQIIIVIALAFILNNFLNADVFFYTFHMKLKYFLMIIGTYCLARILLPPLFLQINKTTTSFSRKGTPVSDREHRQEPQKRNTTNTQENIYFTEHHSINEQQLPESPKKQPIMNKMKFDVKKIGLEIKKVVFVLILLLPVFFLTIINLEKFASIFSNNEGEDIQSFGSFGASFVLVY